MTPAAASASSGRMARVASRVSTLELLLDLVFVFTISQVASIIVDDPSWVPIARAAVTLAVIWWMYDAYVWLTNQATPDTVAVRLQLILAMAAFLVMSLAIPDAFGAAGLLFGVSYLVVVLIHGGIFIARTGPQGARTMLLPGPINVAIALLLIASGFVSGPLDWLFFLLPLPLIVIAGIFATGRGLQLGASHFVERHGLLMIIAFGESIVSVGAGLASHATGPSLIVGAVAAVGIVASLWWCYFSGDDQRAERSFERADEHGSSALALTAFFLCHFVMIMGLVLLAAGLHLALADSFALAPPAASWLMAGGVACYLLGDAEYRRELALGPWHWRVVGAALCLASGLLGLVMPAIWMLVVLIAVVAAVMLTETASRSQSVSSVSG